MSALISPLETVGKELQTRFPEIVALYLFGSRARGGAGEHSDVDLAVLTAPGKRLDPRRFFAYQASVTALLHTDKVDLIWLNQAKLSLQWEIVQTGKLLFCTDGVTVAEFVERVMREASDFAHYSQLCQAWYRAFLTQVYLKHRKATMLDARRITDKIDYIRNTCRPVLIQLAALGAEQFAADPVALGAAKYYLQSAIEAMLDIANHILARMGLGTFETHAKTFETLTEGGILRREYLDTYRRMIGLRNRLVHVYEDVAPDILHRVLGEELDDFDRFIEDVTALLAAEEDKGKET